MATDKEKLTEAYQTVTSNEKAMIVATESAIAAFNTALEAVVADLPAEGANTPARAFVAQLKNQVAVFSSYQLNSLKQQYGLAEQAGNLTPPITTP